MIHPSRYIWSAALAVLAALLLPAAIVWAAADLKWGLLCLLASVLLVFAYHLRKLVALVHWTRDPIGTPTPYGLGLWDYVFANLSRRARVGYDQRERLSQALSRFREASQAMPDGVVYLSHHNTIEWINIAAETHFELDGERDEGQPVTNLVRQPDFVRYIETADYSEPLILRSLRQTGTTLQIQIVPFGEDQHMILSRDITQIDRLETMRRDFVANVSHELKTPLTVVSGFVEMLHDGLEDFSAEDSRRYLRLALDQSGRMQRLIDDLLALSALETAGPMEGEEPIDAHSLLRIVLQEAELLSGGRHRIELHSGPAASVVGAHKELHSALSNLASNAVRYTPDGGTIRLGWLADEQGGEFWVEDNGIGIPAEHIPRLTERFYRVDRGRSRETGGTGLGLAIVKHILTRHQAQLDVRSESGEGSRFTMRFPARRVLRQAVAA
ncbi:phosphate regulon sensor histidine kinase PhoR [Uliginosibacterium sp. H1]|uniref:phosphate regulon sensor histidine kinase PhoR n=1 Tax=Uliginosibacterium sp. H1 TaxID=3114757 RepID=UPI002E178A9A|nr:phosphate regulon sensor histidine kinase PhoR [Uliginosibacterium sp. H1]